MIVYLKADGQGLSQVSIFRDSIAGTGNSNKTTHYNLGQRWNRRRLPCQMEIAMAMMEKVYLRAKCLLASFENQPVRCWIVGANFERGPT